MLENWVWDQKVLDTFAADYRDPNKKIPGDLIERMKAAKLAPQAILLRDGKVIWNASHFSITATKLDQALPKT